MGQIEKIDEQSRRILIADLEETIRMEEEQGQPWVALSRAELLLIQLRYSEAERVLLDHVQSTEGHGKGLGHMHLARLYREMGDTPAALRALQEAAQEPWTAAMSYVEQAELRFDEGDVDTALHLLKRAIDALRDTDAGYAREAVLLYERMNAAGAVMNPTPFKQIVHRFPNWSDYLSAV